MPGAGRSRRGPPCFRPNRGCARRRSLREIRLCRCLSCGSELVGASLGAAKLTIFAAYAAGMMLVLMGLAVTVAFTRQGIARFLRRLLPHTGRLAGLLLVASGGYLVYYWYRLRFGNQLTLADDPVVGFVSRYSGQLESFARQHGTPFIVIAAAAVVFALILGLRQHWRTASRTSGGTVPE